LRDSRALKLVGDRLISVARVVMRDTDSKPLLRVSGAEAALLTRRLLALLQRVSAHVRSPYTIFDIQTIAELAQQTLATAAIPFIDQEDYPTIHEVRESLDTLSAQGMPTLDATIAFVRLAPDRLEALLEEIERDLRSHRPEVVRRTLESATRWLHNVSSWQVPPPPNEIVFSIALMIEDRWSEVLTQALRAAAAAVRLGGEIVTPRFVNPILRGLSALQSETDYHRADFEGWSGIKADDLPAVRAAAASLALALSVAGYSDIPVIQTWLEAAEKDPLPEVRQALRTSY
jgi:hypothetical protein